MHRKRTLEEIAMAEVGHTDFSRGVSSFLVVLFLIIVVAVPAATLWRKHLAPDAATTDASPDLSIGRQFRTLVAAPDLRAALLALRLANAEILHGIKVYEDNTKESSLWVRHIIPHLRVAMAYVGAGNENAYIGRGDWLYYRLDVDYVAGPPFLDPRILARRAKTASEWERSPQPDPVAGILHFRDDIYGLVIPLLMQGKVRIDLDGRSERLEMEDQSQRLQRSNAIQVFEEYLLVHRPEKPAAPSAVVAST